LIDELLTLSRLEAGIARQLPQSVNVAELVMEVVADAAFELDARSASVDFDVRLESLQLASVTGNAEMLHRAAARGTPGHGLGLAITHRVIQSHGGCISASNRASGRPRSRDSPAGLASPALQLFA